MTAFDELDEDDVLKRLAQVRAGRAWEQEGARGSEREG